MFYSMLYKRSGFFVISVIVGTCLFCTSSFGVDCSPGQYLPAGAGACVGCPTTGNVYCPGGTYETGTNENQGLENCPDGTTTNPNRSGCKVSVSQKRMKYGPTNSNSLDRQCWTKTDTREYANCVFPNGSFGIKKPSYKEAVNTTATQQTDK